MMVQIDVLLTTVSFAQFGLQLAYSWHANGGGHQLPRLFMVGYIFYIIDCHICQDIFDRMDIMYYRLTYVSERVIPLKTLLLYIYRP
jgi:hypothetical protein